MADEGAGAGVGAGADAAIGVVVWTGVDWVAGAGTVGRTGRGRGDTGGGAGRDTGAGAGSGFGVAPVGVVTAVSPIAICGVADAARVRSRDNAESTVNATSRSGRPLLPPSRQPATSPAAVRQSAGHSMDIWARYGTRAGCMDGAPLR